VEEEVRGVLARIDPAPVERLRAILEPGHWGSRFFAGQGRSGLVARLAAMRVMHLGGSSHVVGDATTPAFRSEDTLIVVSASGKTPTALLNARMAHDIGGMVCSLTVDPTSPLGLLSDPCVVIPAGASAQFGTVLFTQAALLLLDGVFLSLSRGKDQFMWQLHANLE
jgi:6-phospho-3-hexuloisomerase